jgi:hypothetical protein
MTEEQNRTEAPQEIGAEPEQTFAQATEELRIFQEFDSMMEGYNSARQRWEELEQENEA